MLKLNILCVDDQREVLAALVKDLQSLQQHAELLQCEAADEAQELLDELDADGKPIALIICDHVMPGRNGIDFLIEVNSDARFSATRKLLLTGMATHQDTITAINEANIERYIEKPWDPANLIENVRFLLTRYIIAAGLEYEPYLPVLDQQILYKELHRNG